MSGRRAPRLSAAQRTVLAYLVETGTVIHVRNAITLHVWVVSADRRDAPRLSTPTFLALLNGEWITPTEASKRQMNRWEPYAGAYEATPRGRAALDAPS